MCETVTRLGLPKGCVDLCVVKDAKLLRILRRLLQSWTTDEFIVIAEMIPALVAADLLAATAEWPRLRSSEVLSILIAVKIRFYLDPANGLPHILNHGVAEEEVEDVLTNPAEDRPGREGSRVAIGQTSAGRYLRVIYVRDPEVDSVFVVTAYELGRKALSAYRRRRRKKHK